MNAIEMPNREKTVQTIYEVNLTVETNLSSGFADWLTSHVDAMLKIDGFLGARWLELSGPNTADQIRWTIHYELRDNEALEHYLKHHAKTMREDGKKRFGESFSATRRTFELCREWKRD